jgi:ABC-2 type transport system ATP-binding protein
MIDVNQLLFSYGTEKIFKNIDLKLEPNNVYGLLGLNGAGKSTLLKLMTGLLFPQEGTIRALGATPAERTPTFLQQVFMLPEELNLPSLTDREYLWAQSRLYPKFDRNRFDHYVREFSLPTGRRLHKLSYGQKKKFLLSFGLASGAPLVLLDEPTNGLDIPSKAQFRRVVAEALTEDRVFVISTHQVRDVESLIDPIVVLHDGRVLFNHSMSDVTSRIRMTHTPTRPEGGESGLLYREPALGGIWSVYQDATAEDGHVDLEVLFNTVITKPELYSSVFDARGEVR